MNSLFKFSLLFVLIISFSINNYGQSLTSVNMNTQKQPKLIYVYDALCGWCYGFSPVIGALKEKYGAQISFEVISGGMIIGEREGPISEVAPYIKTAYKTVEQHTGVKFGEAFVKRLFEPDSSIFSSWLPSLAMTAFKTLNPNNSIEYAAYLQKAIYFDGYSPSDAQFISNGAVPLGINKDDFEKKMADEAIKKLTIQDFQRSSQLGVSGFPTVLLVNNNEIEILTNGYSDFNTLDRKLGKWLERLKK